MVVAHNSETFTMFIPSYLSLSRHNIYYFRWPLPISVNKTGKKDYIKLSLNTRNPKEAMHISKCLELSVNKIMDQLDFNNLEYALVKEILKIYFTKELTKLKEKQNYFGRPFKKELLALQQDAANVTKAIDEGDNEILNVAGDNRHLTAVLEGCNIPNVTPDGDTWWRLQEEYKFAKHAYLAEVIKHMDGLIGYSFDTKTSASSPFSIEQSSSIEVNKLQEIVEKYIEDNIRFKRWNEKTLLDRRNQLDVLCEVLGKDFNIVTIKAADARAVKEIVCKIPSSRKKMPQTRDLKLMEAIEVVGMDKLSSKTIDEYLTAYSGFFNWAINQSYASSNYFSGMKVEGQKDSKTKDDFKDEQIKIIYDELQSNSKGLVKEDHQYWGTMLAIFTGARLEEICQLHVEDIKSQDDIWYIDINDKEIKQLKNKSSIRKIPIHSKLIEQGFIEYLTKLKAARSVRLFPVLNYQSKHGFGRQLSHWFNNNFVKKVVVDREERTFHSFRHTAVTRMRRSNITPSIADRVTGHAAKGVGERVYMKEYEIEQLKEAVEGIKFKTF